MKLAANCYVRILATGKVGRITNKYRDEYTGKITWGVAWDIEYPGNEMERITPKEYHASLDGLKITSYASALN